MQAIEWRELGPLRLIEEFRWSGEGKPWLLALRLGFEHGAVTVEADTDDTIVVAHLAVDPASRQDWAGPRNVSDSEPWIDVLGSSVLWARQMTNHHGWADGFQLEFAHGDDSVGTCVDLIAISSGLRVGRCQFLKAQPTPTAG